jgi:Protein of unknown function (DUF2934)
MKSKLGVPNDAANVGAPEKKIPIAALSFPPAQATSEEQLHQQIRELAFQLYQQRGCIDGHAERDWLEAEAIIRQEGKTAA